MMIGGITVWYMIKSTGCCLKGIRVRYIYKSSLNGHEIMFFILPVKCFSIEILVQKVACDEFKQITIFRLIFHETWLFISEVNLFYFDYCIVSIPFLIAPTID